MHTETRVTRYDSLLTPEMRDRLEQSTIDVADAVHMPPETYTSEEWFAFEREAIFERSWLCVGRVDQVPEPGDFLTLTINDDPLLIVRGTDGEIRVMSNVCQHRGHLLTEEPTGNAERGTFRCPLHFWAFDTEGALVNAPNMQETNSFDKSKFCLPQLAVEIWNGFIFCNYQLDAEPLAPTLVQLDEEMQNYNVSSMINLPPINVPGYPWNWRIMLENFMEPYHNLFLHKGIHDFASQPAFVDHDPSENVIMHPTGFDQPDQGFNPIHKALLPPISSLTPQQHQRVMFAMIPPLMSLGMVPDHMFYFLILPNGANEITLRISICVPPESTEVKNFERITDWIVDGVMDFNNQDVAANTSVQKGLRSKFAPSVPALSWKETTIVQLNRWLVKRYFDFMDQLKA